MSVHDLAYERPLLNPAALAAQWSLSPLAPAGQAADARIEDYLSMALARWLPEAFPVHGAADADARRGLAALARQQQDQHHDAWLADLLASAPVAGAEARSFAQGMAALATAVEANATGRTLAAEAASTQAAAGFDAAHSQPGRLRAQHEHIYALHRLEHYVACNAQISPVIAGAHARGYAWIEADTRIERSNCQGGNGKMTLAANNTAAVRLSRAHAYPALALRSALSQAADHADPFPALQRLLAEYWSNQVSDARGYQIYAFAAARATQAGQAQAALRLEEAAVERIARSPELSFQALARQRLATLALRAGSGAAASQQYARHQYALAEAIFARLPADAATANYRALNEITLAGLDLQAGQRVPAAAELARFRHDQPAMVDADYRMLPYYQIGAALQLAQRDWPAAEPALDAAVAISEANRNASDQARLAWDARTFDAYRGLTEVELEGHHDPAAALEIWEWALGASLRPATASSQAVPTLLRLAHLDASLAPAIPVPRLVRATLPRLSQRQVLTYAFLPEGLVMWHFDDHGIEMRRVPAGAAQIESVAGAFARACADPASNPAERRRLGQQLYAWLIAPFAAQLDPGRLLVIEADGGLGAIPFAALPLPGGHYLGEEFALERSPGLDYAHLERTAEPLRASDPMLAVGDPSLGGGQASQYAALPEAARDAQAAGAEFAPLAVLTGPAATRAAVLARLPQAEIFHFAGHAVADSLRQGLLLAPVQAGGADTLLSAGDFTPRTLPRLQLAVLAGCSTAPGADSGLTDAHGLVRALLRAGVPASVATQWDIDSATAQSFDAALFAALRAAQPVARALQSAQAAVRAQPGHAAPFYWASFATFAAQY